MARWVSAWLAVGLLGLVAARLGVRPERDDWLVIGAGHDESVSVVDYTVANTGLFAEQLTSRVTVLRREGSVLAHRAVSGPATVDDEGIHGTADGLTHEPGGWSWRVEGEAMRVRGRSRDVAAGCPPTPGRATGILDVPNDDRGNGEGANLDGRVLLARTHAVGNEAGAALYAVDNRGLILLDPRGSCPGVLVVDGVTETGPPPWIAPEPDEEFVLNFGGHQLEVHVGKQQFTERPDDTTLLPERLLAWAVGYRLPELTLRRARISVDGAASWTGVLLLRTAPAPWEP